MSSTSGIRAGRAFVVIDAVDKTGAVLNRIAGQFVRFGNKLEAMGQRILSRVFLTTLPAAFGLNFFKNFDDTMRKVEARSKGTASEMQALRDQARSLGKDSAFSAEQVGVLQDKLATMGYNRGEIHSLTPNVLNLARAAGEVDPITDVQQAVEAVQAALKGFNIEASRSSDVVQKLAAAANLSNFTVKDLAIAMGYSSTIAKAYNVELDEMLAIMAMWKNLGFDASVVGTAFRNIALEGSDAASIDKFNQQLGEMANRTIQFADAAGNLKDPAILLFEIGNAIKGLGTAQQGSLMNVLFGKRAVVPALALASGGKTYAELLAQIRSAGGSDIAGEMAAKMDQGIGGAWRRFVHGLQDVAITLGEILEPALISISSNLASTMSSFSQWAAAHKSAIIGVIEAVAVLSTYAVALVAVGHASRMLGRLNLFVAAAFTTIAVAVKVSGIAFATHYAYLIATRAAYIGFRGTVIAVTTALTLIPAILTAIKVSAVTLKVAFTVLVAEMAALWTTLKTAVFVFRAGLFAYGIAEAGILAAAYLFQAACAYSAAMATNILSAAVVGLGISMGALLVPLAIVGAAILAWPLIFGAVSKAAQLTFDVIVASLRFAHDGFKTVSNVAVSTFNFMYSRGKEVGSTLIDTFNAVNAAMQLGDLDRAWAVSAAGLKLAWLESFDAVRTAWEELTNAFLKTLHMVSSFSTDWLGHFVKQLRFLASLMGPVASSIIGSLNSFDATSMASDIHGTVSGAIEYYSADADQSLAFRKQMQAVDQLLRRQKIERDKLLLESDKSSLTDEASDRAKEFRHKDSADTSAPVFDGLGGLADAISPRITVELKALEALDMRLVESAKAAYEASMRQLDMAGEDVAKEGLVVIKNIRDQFGQLLEVATA